MKLLSWSRFFTLFVIYSISSVELDAIDSNPCGFTTFGKVKTCRGKQLMQIPYRHLTLDNNQTCFETVDLGVNNISVLNTSEFSHVPCRNSIRFLYLDHNAISKITHNSFTELPELESLDLSFNNLTNIGTHFCHVRHLKELILDGNRIERIAKNAFRCHKSLKYLSLKNISLRKLPVDFLVGSGLERLDLSGNCIENMDDVYLPPNMELIPPENCTIASTNNTTIAGTNNTTIGSTIQIHADTNTTSSIQNDVKLEEGREEETGTEIHALGVAMGIVIFIVFIVLILAILKKDSIKAWFSKRSTPRDPPNDPEENNWESNARLVFTNDP